MTDKVLIIDDDLDTLLLVRLMLQKQGHKIAAIITSASELFAQMINLNTAAVNCQPESMTNYKITILTSILVENENNKR